MMTASLRSSSKKGVHHRTGSIQKDPRTITEKTVARHTRIGSAEVSSFAVHKERSQFVNKRRNGCEEETKKTINEKIDEISTTANITLDVSKGKSRCNRSTSIRLSAGKLFVKPGTDLKARRNATNQPSPREFRKEICRSFKSPQAKIKARRFRPWHRSITCTFHPRLCDDSEDERMKSYFAKKKELRKKYENLLDSLQSEESSAIELVLTKFGEKGRLKAAIEDVKNDYEITKNLLLQQKLMEEEELLKTCERILEAE